MLIIIYKINIKKNKISLLLQEGEHRFKPHPHPGESPPQFLWLLLCPGSAHSFQRACLMGMRGIPKAT